MTVATVDNQSFTTGRPDADDVALAATGDRLAFERVYRAHVNRVFAICARMVVGRGAHAGRVRTGVVEALAVPR